MQRDVPRDENVLILANAGTMAWVAKIGGGNQDQENSGDDADRPADARESDEVENAGRRRTWVDFLF